MANNIHTQQHCVHTMHDVYTRPSEGATPKRVLGRYIQYIYIYPFGLTVVRLVMDEGQTVVLELGWGMGSGMMQDEMDATRWKQRGERVRVEKGLRQYLFRNQTRLPIRARGAYCTRARGPR